MITGEVHTKFALTIQLLCLLLLCSTAVATPDDFRRRAHQVTGNRVLDVYDIKAEIRFGRDIAARILGKRNLYADAKLTRYINLVGQSLAQNCNRPELFFHFAILDSAHINAYSTPGGYVFITLGAIRHMNDEAELAAVLAHEIAHITRRHIVKELNIHAADTSLVSSLSVFLGGSSETAKVAFLQAVDQAVSILFSKGYKIQDELDADHTATILLANSGYDPLALQRYLTRVESLTKKDAVKTPTTHPSSAQRMLALTQLINDEKLTHLNYPNGRQRFIQYVDIR